MKIFEKLVAKLGIQRSDCFCPVCGTNGVFFSPLPDMYRQNAEKFGYVHFGKGEMTALDTYFCATCGASDRERLYAYWIRQQISTGKMPRDTRVIHFSPEMGLSALIRNSNFFDDYQTADLSNDGVDHNVDLLHLPFENDSFDFFICSHILEHVQDDRKAIRELFRITKPQGYGILMAPIIVGLEKTLEDPSITSGAERWRLFGQDDHVRLYSHNDYVNRIEIAGFVLEQLDRSYFGANVFDRLGLKKTSILYIARKP
jgi:SAM-dependent methyltransferase